MIKNAFEQLGEGCKAHFGVDNQNNKNALDKWIDQKLEFLDLRQVDPSNNSSAFGVHPDSVLGKASGTTTPTIWVGGAFFDPSKATTNDKPLPQENTTEIYQRNVLVHEYNHARYGYDHQKLFAEWDLGKYGYKVDGDSYLDRDQSAQKAVNQFIAKDCK